MPTCAWWAPGTPGSRPALELHQEGQIGRRPRSPRPDRRPDLDPAPLRRHAGRPRRCVAGPEARCVFGLARDFGVPTYKTWVKGAHLLVDDGRMLRYRGSSRRSALSAVLTIALAQAPARLGVQAGPARCAVDGEASRRSGTRARWRGGSSIPGSERSWRRDLFDMAVRGLFTGDLDDTSYLHLLFLVRAHGSINTLFSIKGGSQENMMEGGAGLDRPAHGRVLGRCRAPRRPGPLHHPTRGPCRGRRAGVVGVGAATPWSCVPPALVLDIAFDPVLPDDRTDALLGAPSPVPSPRPSSSTTSRSGGRTGFSGQSAGPGSAAEVTLDASPPSGTPGVLASFTFGPVADARQHARRRRERRRAVLDALAARFGPRCGVSRRVHRDRVVDRAVDARVARWRTSLPGS